VRTLRALVTLVAAVVVAACGPPAADPGDAATDASSTTVSRSAASTTTTPAPTATATTTARSTIPVVPPELLGTVWTVVPTRLKRVALTFDCGGNADGLPSILATLAARKVPRATFFVTGDWARAFPDEAAALGTLGYVVGNHTDHHLRLPDLTNAEVRTEIRLGRIAVGDATEVDPKPWLRFPYGAYDARVLGITERTGWVTLGWTVDTLGWKGTSGGQTVDSVVQRVLAGLTPGEIVLMHVGSNPDDGTTLDADALGRVIHDLRAAGYRFFTPVVMLSTPLTNDART
jgi:peptidoglycan/xylan/chitin deacetylase (PgdA/CDA1 family)